MVKASREESPADLFDGTRAIPTGLQGLFGWRLPLLAFQHIILQTVQARARASWLVAFGDYGRGAHTSFRLITEGINPRRARRKSYGFRLERKKARRDFAGYSRIRIIGVASPRYK